MPAAPSLVATVSPNAGGPASLRSVEAVVRKLSNAGLSLSVSRMDADLLSGTDEVGITGADELGEFGFRAVPPETYQILISSDRVEILISPIELSA